MVLDTLIKIKNEMDSKLMFRHSCWEGIYGSCAMNIDRRNGLTCLTKIESGTNTTITLLPHMFVIKNPVVDMTNFYNQCKSKEPWLKRKNPPHVPGKEILQSKKDKAKLDGIYECILCACCSTSCPNYCWNPESYLGPAALLHANWDGVSESQFNQVLNMELDQVIEVLRAEHCPLDLVTQINILCIFQACKFLDENWSPKFVVIVAQKNHHTKFFKSGSPDNVPPGRLLYVH
ncbi:hypothetical protein FNV43_RR14790 [Rhamnella rubrinervis]|uniref:succinate dehydrogenase n=1 Tax=Rhamnella rubrinervis TaxID=2594499 RepID=A0A8K0H3G2_9ROSA|nr:hypothetical protein FNV43_RR14790 [Rhamnella rubrinervis]